MNKIILKQAGIISFLTGIILGVITLIPVLGGIAFGILMCFISTVVILFMIKLEILKLNSVQESSVLGAIIGFIAFCGFSTSYVPFIIALAKLFQIYPNYGISMALSNASFGIILMLTIFMGILCATVNAFSGFLTFYGIDIWKMVNKKDNEHFKLK